MHWDLMWDQEIDRLNDQHKRELENHKISLNVMWAALRHQKEAQQV